MKEPGGERSRRVSCRAGNRSSIIPAQPNGRRALSRHRMPAARMQPIKTQPEEEDRHVADQVSSRSRAKASYVMTAPCNRLERL
jgi:hypothetical protein